MIPTSTPSGDVHTKNPNIVIRSDAVYTAIDLAKKQIEELQRTHQHLRPKSPYLIVNTSDNIFILMKDNQPILKGKCSTGSYILLKTDGDRQWLFKTPRGIFKVTMKLKNPVWYKPDWAYLEDGLSIPSRESPKRYQDGVLGDFALGFGQGYLIHGTLYKRMLGLPVTHGCVRLGDDDMYQVFQKLTHGSKIFIY